MVVCADKWAADNAPEQEFARLVKLAAIDGEDALKRAQNSLRPSLQAIV
jgi:hypothetical protein